MSNFLDKFIPDKLKGKPSPSPAKPKNTVSVYSVGPMAKPVTPPPPAQAALPRAAAIYGGAAAVFAVLTVFYLIKGIWITGLILILPTVCLAGFAYHNLKS